MGRSGARTAVLRPRNGQTLSLYCLAVDRVSLSASSNLLGLRRSGASASRALGWRLDDARALAALPSVGQFRSRFRAERFAVAGALVPALALRPVVVDQPRPRDCMTIAPNGGDRSVSNAAPLAITADHRDCLASCCSRSLASVDPISDAFWYQAAACMMSASAPRTPSCFNTVGS